jgi:hypothetical protein
VVSCAADRTPAAQKITSRFTRSRNLFGRERHVMRELGNYPQSRPFALEITGGDFAFAVGHRRAISLLAAILNSAAAISIAVLRHHSSLSLYADVANDAGTT